MSLHTFHKQQVHEMHIQHIEGFEESYFAELSELVVNNVASA